MNRYFEIWSSKCGVYQSEITGNSILKIPDIKDSLDRLGFYWTKSESIFDICVIFREDGKSPLMQFIKEGGEERLLKILDHLRREKIESILGS